MTMPTQSLQPADPPKPATQNVYVLNAPEVEKRSWRAQRWRRRFMQLSFLLLVILPVALVSAYYLAIATDRYAVETKFAIRSPAATAPSDLLGIVSGFSTATSTITDSYMVVDFIESRDLIDRLQDRLDLATIYDREDADLLMRLDGSASKEDLVRYFSRMTSIYFDNTSQILTLEVQAFTPEDAHAVSTVILDLVGELVNEVSEAARADTMRSAEREVARIESLLRDHRRKMTEFRQSEQDLDPAASAEARTRLLGELEGQLAVLDTRMSSLRGFLSEDAPRIRVLRSQIEALERQVEEQRARLGVPSEITGTDGLTSLDIARSITMRIATYEDLAVDLEFLQQAYLATLASREAARIETDRAQRYVAVFVRPSLPQKSLYPKRVQNILVFAGFAIMLWGIGLMIVYIVREHSS